MNLDGDLARVELNAVASFKVREEAVEGSNGGWVGTRLEIQLNLDIVDAVNIGFEVLTDESPGKEKPDISSAAMACLISVRPENISLNAKLRDNEVTASAIVTTPTPDPIIDPVTNFLEVGIPSRIIYIKEPEEIETAAGAWVRNRGRERL